MEPGTLEQKIAKLPEELKQKVEDYVDTLMNLENRSLTISEPEVIYKKSKVTQGNHTASVDSLHGFFEKESSSKPKKKREFGSLKGFVTYMADDFDAPMGEFNHYI